MKTGKGSLNTLNLGKQGGASFFCTVMLLVIVGVTLLFGLKVAPAYLDNNVISNAMEGLANNDLENMTIPQIRESLRRSLQTNNISGAPLQNMQEATVEGRDYIDINYESRVHLFYNIDIVVVFENRFPRN
jgi:hypothetical protein